MEGENVTLWPLTPVDVEFVDEVNLGLLADERNDSTTEADAT